MDDGILKDAKFGDRFLTRDGSSAIYIQKDESRKKFNHRVIVLDLEGGVYDENYNEYGVIDGSDPEIGIDNLDIVSRYADSVIQEFGDACYDRGYSDANNFEYGRPEEGNILFEEFTNKGK